MDQVRLFALGGLDEDGKNIKFNKFLHRACATLCVCATKRVAKAAFIDAVVP